MPYEPIQWTKTNTETTFHLGINMAGAVSAGAYTAGALDFLMQAIEQWYTLKATDPAVPKHNLSIDAFSGASAGGMCAAIASVMVQAPFDHIWNAEDPKVKGTTNTFYESWVNQIDIEPLLGKEDLKNNQPLVSLLDSTIIDSIADRAIVPGPPETPEYISNSLTLFMTLTNVRGTPFSLNGDAVGSAEEAMAYYADRIQFETVPVGLAPLSPFAKPLPLGTPGPAWNLLKEAAKATGAFPAFLAPRAIPRPMEDYIYMPWLSADRIERAVINPAWTLKSGETITTLNVDGGMTDNDPFQLAHDFLAIHNPQAVWNDKTGHFENPQPPEKANSAVLTVAPFPTKDLFKSSFDSDQSRGIFTILPMLFTALISQSRFLGESLICLLSESSFSRFVLAPSDDTRPNQDALQCGLLGAFGGFFERGFRAHDYQLGRRNCQRFLSEHFVLAEENPIIQSGLTGMTAEARQEAEQKHSRMIKINGQQRRMYRIIPLCGSAGADAEVSHPSLATITQSRVNHVVSMVADRLHAVSGPLVDELCPPGFGNWSARTAVNTLITIIGKAKVGEYIQAKLKDVISD